MLRLWFLSSSVCPLQVFNSRTESSTAKAHRVSKHQMNMAVQGPARTEIGFATFPYYVKGKENGLP